MPEGAVARIGSRIQGEDEEELSSGPRSAPRWRFDETNGELSITTQLPALARFTGNGRVEPGGPGLWRQGGPRVLAPRYG
jgi:hypothetical protein